LHDFSFDWVEQLRRPGERTSGVRSRLDGATYAGKKTAQAEITGAARESLPQAPRGGVSQE
jgi:hypothetical protein